MSKMIHRLYTLLELFPNSFLKEFGNNFKTLKRSEYKTVYPIFETFINICHCPFAFLTEQYVGLCNVSNSETKTDEMKQFSFSLALLRTCYHHHFFFFKKKVLCLL